MSALKTSNNLKQLGIAIHNHHIATTQRSLNALVARGVSLQGARQFLGGEVVTGPGDRHLLAAMMGELAAAQNSSATAMLLPAIQQAREAARQKPAPARHGSGWMVAILPYMEQDILSPVSKRQFAAGLPVSDANDRAALTDVMIAALERAGSTHSGGVNVLFGDGSVRF